MRKAKGKFQQRDKYASNRGVHSVWDLGRVQSDNAPAVVESSPRSIAELMEREKRAAQAKELAAQREQYDARLREFYSRAVDAESLIGPRDDFAGLASGESDPQAGAKFVEELSQSGISLLPSARQKIAYYAQSQNSHSLGKIAITVANLHRAFERLKALGCLDEDEVNTPIELPVAAPVEETTPLTMDEVLSKVDTRTKAGSELLKRVTDRAWMESFGPLISEFWSFMASEYGVPGRDADAQALFGPTGMFVQRGWAINADNLNSARRHFANLGIFVDSEGNPAISVQEYLDARLSRGELDRPTYMRECTRFARMNKLTRPIREAKGLF